MGHRGWTKNGQEVDINSLPWGGPDRNQANGMHCIVTHPCCDEGGPDLDGHPFILCFILAAFLQSQKNDGKLKKERRVLMVVQI